MNDWIEKSDPSFSTLWTRKDRAEVQMIDGTIKILRCPKCGGVRRDVIRWRPAPPDSSEITVGQVIQHLNPFK